MLPFLVFVGPFSSLFICYSCLKRHRFGSLKFPRTLVKHLHEQTNKKYIFHSRNTKSKFCFPSANESKNHENAQLTNNPRLKLFKTPTSKETREKQTCAPTHAPFSPKLPNDLRGARTAHTEKKNNTKTVSHNKHRPNKRTRSHAEREREKKTGLLHSLVQLLLFDVSRMRHYSRASAPLAGGGGGIPGYF